MNHVSKTGIKALAQVMEGLNSGNWGSIDLDDWLVRASVGTDATVSEIKSKGLSPEDLVDIQEGKMSYEALKCFVKVWCDMGKPHQNCIAATKQEVKQASEKVMERYADTLHGLSKR